MSRFRELVALKIFTYWHQMEEREMWFTKTQRGITWRMIKKSSGEFIEKMNVI